MFVPVCVAYAVNNVDAADTGRPPTGHPQGVHTCSRGGTYCCTSSLQKNAPCERDHLARFGGARAWGRLRLRNLALPAFRKRSQYQRPTLVVYEGPRKILCFSTGDISGLASLEQAFHMWYHLSSTLTTEECVGVPREVVPLSVQALTCLRGTTPLTLDLN